MITEKWNPGHSLKKGYPWCGAVSKDQLPNRVRIVLETDNVLTVHPQGFEEPKAEDVAAHIDFLTSRCFDFQEALKSAEDQIAEMMTEDPFVPEDLGFELVHKPETIHDSPVRIYSSKYDDRFTLHREVLDIYDENMDASQWVIMKKRPDSDKFDRIEVKIPCYRIAYALFWALGVIMEPAQEPAAEAPVTEEKP